MSINQTSNDVSLSFSCVLGKNIFTLDSMDGVEGISTLFNFTLVAHTHNSEIDCKSLLGTEAVVMLKLDTSTRYFSGIIGAIEQGESREASNGDFYIFYEIQLRPKMWLLDFTKDHRIFQNEYTLDIIIQILKENGVTSIENRVSPVGRGIRSYCVQYGESCFHFISRLMEEEGISYYFTYSENEHLLVLMDRNNTDQPVYENLQISKSVLNRTPTMNQITSFSSQYQITASQYKAVDYNYMTPSLPLRSHVNGIGAGGLIYEYPAKFDDLQTGDFLASCRMNELEWPQNIVSGKSTAPLLGAATTFVLSNHLTSNINNIYFVYEVKHQITRFPVYDLLDGIDLENCHTTGRAQFLKNPKESPLFLNLYDNQFLAIPDQISFVSRRYTTKPRIHSNQTAIVVGPPNEEIYCDNLGRIKIQFYWDVRGNFNTNSSCWVRVAQNWAGAGWGGLVLPRIGMEVIVSFIDGDPDRPIVVGCVYNADNKPPSYVTANPTKSTFRTNSTRKAGSYNELSMDDAVGNEAIAVTAAKNMTMNVAGNYSLTLASGSSNTTLASGDMSEILNKGNKTLTLTAGNYTISLTKGGIQIKTAGDVSIFSGGILNLSGNTVNINSRGAINLSSASMNLSASSMNLSASSTINISANVSVAMKFPGMLPTFPVNTAVKN